MTPKRKRKAELETENRMLREQVASLERIVEQLTHPLMRAEPFQVTWEPATSSAGSLP